MKISVTKSDIEKGLLGDPFSCPVARAIRRASGKDFWVRYAWICNNSGYVHDLPIAAQKFINRFDDELPVKPFSFNLKLKRK